jgi:hypothetical protein
MDWTARFTELLGNCHMGNIVGRENPVFNCDASGRKTIMNLRAVKEDDFQDLSIL